MREVRENVALSSRGLQRPTADSQPMCTRKLEMQVPVSALEVIPAF